MLRRYLPALLLLCALRTSAEGATWPDSGQGSINGTVLDVNDGIVPRVDVVLRCQRPCDGQSTTANDTGAFEFRSLGFGVSYELEISARGFKKWKSEAILLTPERSVVLLTDVRIQMAEVAESVTVHASSGEIATEQVHLQEQQRVLGFLPNFYAVYDSSNAAPLSSKLKFKLAMRASADPITILGIGAYAGIEQAAGTPNYLQGAKGYGQRFGAAAAKGFSNVLLGDAVLPSLLHQDPRYFYQGTGTTSSRMRHALLSPFICRGDNGQTQFNFSSLGGTLAASALTETYYPDSNRGPRLVFGNFAVGTGERMLSAVLQEFVIPRFTSRAKH
jgi:hypothetical protein